MAGAGLLAAVHRQPCDLQSVHPAGGRRGALASASPGSQPSAIGNRPAARGFSGAVVLVCGDTDGLFPGRSAHGETRHGWYLRGDSAEQLPRLAQYRRRRVRRWYRRFPCCWRWYRAPPLREHLAQSLRDWRRSIVQCRTRLNGLPPVWSVFWVTPSGGRAGESRWFTITPERPGPCAAEGTSAPVGCRVAAGGQLCLTPASDAVAGEHSDLGRKRSFPAIPRPAGGTSSAEPVCRGHLPYAGGGGGE